MTVWFGHCSCGSPSDCLFVLQEEDEENFVMIALFAAVEDGNTAGVEELLETATQYDINYANKVCQHLHMSP